MFPWWSKRPDPRDLLTQRMADLRQAFFRAASDSGLPRGLRWKAVEWGQSVEIVREKETGRLAALHSVTISFEAIEGGEMEGVEAVGNLRAASALFFFHDGAWHTTGKALFNLEPADVLSRFAKQYERA